MSNRSLKETTPLLSESMHIIPTSGEDINEILLDARKKNIKTIYLVPVFSEVLTEPINMQNEPPPDGIFPSVKRYRFIVSILLGLLSFLISYSLFENKFAGKCCALLIFVSILWASEAIPLYVTSLSIPFLVVLLRILPSNTNPDIAMPTYQAAKEISNAFWSPTIFLFLGGFSIALALEKFSLNKFLATAVLSRVGSNPKVMLFSMMCICAFLSMWISNPAASVLCVSLILPVIHNLPQTSKFPRLILLGIAFAGNIGGMTTPIASAQNAIAVNILASLTDPIAMTFFDWMAVSLPICCLLIIITFFCLIFFVQTEESSIPEIKKENLVLKFEHYFIISVILITISLWLLHGLFSSYIGDIGMTALIPVVLFYGSGYLKVKDFDGLSWNTLMLVGGGMALGSAIEKSQLLNIITDRIADVIDDQTHLWTTLLIFVTMMLVIATFVSSTVSAIIILPVVAEIGVQIGHARLLVVACAIMCSGAMSLPVSSFPNANSYSIKEEETQKPIVGVMDYIKSGLIITVAVAVLCQTVMYFEAVHILNW